MGGCVFGFKFILLVAFVDTSMVSSHTCHNLNTSSAWPKSNQRLSII